MDSMMKQGTGQIMEVLQKKEHEWVPFLHIGFGCDISSRRIALVTEGR
jgi:hypothetical protein